MPELPEVENTIMGLRRNIIGKKFADVWTDWAKTIKKPKDFKQFKKGIAGKKVLKIKRRGKNIIFELSGKKTLLIHQKMTGHLLFGKWKKKMGKWIASKGPMSDPMNRFLHLIFIFSDGKMMAFSDLRKFGKVELWKREDFKNNSDINQLGPEPLEKSFSLSRFKKIAYGKKGKIKQVLMDQKAVSGIGNIYSDEILWRARVHPLKPANKLSDKELKDIYGAMKEILQKAIKLGGESISDYRKPDGKRGNFDKIRKIYRREGEKCFRCLNPIKRIKIGGRSAHYCPFCQK
ncbi:MAG: DNA-formamidopyrimidine glycosylase [Candidatus Nealsonbacteria bacterium]|nr:DNA-formamidopyrimidine glycosylase [Candidatus Nealsonbacteria bacterium]